MRRLNNSETEAALLRGEPHVCLPNAGDKPNRRTDTSAIEEAVSKRRYDVVDKIGIDPRRDNLDCLFESVCLTGDAGMVDKLLSLGAQPKGKDCSQRPMENAMWHLRHQMESHFGLRSEAAAKDSIDLVVRLADLGARWNPDISDLRRLRRELIHFGLDLTESMVMAFREHQVCAPEVLLKLIGSPKMKTTLRFRYKRLVELLKTKPQTDPR